MEDKQLAEALARSAQDGGSTSGVPPEQQTASFPEEKITHLTSMGFKRDEAVAELTRCNGDANLAAAALLARSLKLPAKK